MRTRLLAALALPLVLLLPRPAATDLLVSSFNTDQVLRYDGSTGAFRGVFASGGGLDFPSGLTFGPDGNLYVSSQNTHRVLRYNGSTGAFLGVFASGGGLDGPTFLTFTPESVVVPEPSSLALVGLGALGLLGYVQRRRRAVAE